MKHFVIIDGHHLMYRAYWAIPRTLRTKSGEQTNVAFGVAAMLISILKEEEPDALLFCFDAGEDTFRHRALKEYKEGRAETPEEFYDQIPRVIGLLEAFRLHHVSDERFEADDFLCTYAKASERAGFRVSVITGDRDALQLASDRIAIVIPHKGYKAPERMGPGEVEKKFGIRPDQVSAFKGLTGDTSDNLPGVHGIGPKTAARLLQRFGTLEALYEALDTLTCHDPLLTPSIVSKLRAGREQAFFCQEMSKLVCDIPLSIPLSDLALTKLPCTDILAFLRALEFTLLERRLLELLRTPYGARTFAASTELSVNPQPSLFADLPTKSTKHTQHL